MLQEKLYSTGKVDINYAQGPANGPAIVLLHGLPGHWQEFKPIIPHLTLDHQVYAVDMRGQGKSTRTPGQYKAKYYADDLGDFLAGNFNQPVIVFGMSAGGVVALEAAARWPELVRAVIVGDSPLDIDHLVDWMISEQFKAYFTALREIASLNISAGELAREIADILIKPPGQDAPIRYADSPGVDKLKILQLANVLHDMDPGVLEYHAEGRAQEFLEGLDMEVLLGSISCSVFLLQGNPELGAMLSDETVHMVQTSLKDSIHIRIETAGHNLGMDTWQTAVLLRALSAFLGLLRSDNV